MNNKNSGIKELAMGKDIVSIDDVREKAEVVVNLVTAATSEMVRSFNRIGAPKLIIITKSKLAYADIGDLPDGSEERVETFRTLGKNFPEAIGDDCYAFVLSAEAYAQKVNGKTGEKMEKVNCIHISAIDIEGFEFQRIIPFDDYKLSDGKEFKELEKWTEVLGNEKHRSLGKELLISYKFALFSKEMNRILGKKNE